MKPAPICRIDRDLYLIPLPQPMRGFDRFICAWLMTGNRNLLVDVGPSGSIPFLLSALNELGISKIDAILLTHIHLDHAGGIGEVTARWPDTPVLCHPKAMKHLANPAALWEGSLKTLGDRARVYGPMSSVPEDRIFDAVTFGLSGVEVIDTPGHAPHHLSYRIGRNMFIGEAGGVYQQLPDGKYYMRPATPPKFFLETTLKSIDQLLHCRSERLCYGHFGATQHPAAVLQLHCEQLLRWRDVIAADAKNFKPTDERAMLNHLLTVDPLLSGWKTLGEAIQDREYEFMMNSIKGYIGYLQKSENA